MKKAIWMPRGPPRRPPINMIRPVITPSKSVVFTKLVTVPPSYECQPRVPGLNRSERLNSPWRQGQKPKLGRCEPVNQYTARSRAEEHTSELQSQSNLVCRLLL